MLRRLRQDKHIRELVREVTLDPRKFIQPLFVVEGLKEREPIPGLSEVYRDTSDSILKQIENDLERGVHKFLIFGVPSEKRSEGFDFGSTAREIAAIKKRFGADLWLAADVCLCSYTSHGHCGVLNAEGSQVINDKSVEALAQAALSYAQAGVNCVAPSDMMDGRVAAIRRILDANSLSQTLIMSYAVKFQSNFYGPFRVAADSAPNREIALKDRASYQLDPLTVSQAYQCAERDVSEGADILMVKPGLPYLDILADLSRRIAKPWAAYEVSGEYAAIELLAREGLIDARKGHLESWGALTRAGAQIIISYGARHASHWLRG